MQRTLPRYFAEGFILRFTLAALIILLSNPLSVTLAQEYQIKNDRILAPEVSHFTRITTPGIDGHGDLSLALPLLTVPGRDGLDFDLVAQYRSGIQVSQSASWIGLGWELDLGSMTRHALGGVVGYKQADFAHALNDDGADKIETQPDVYVINMNGTSTLLLSMTKEVNPNIPFDPANSETTGPCSGTNLYSQWFFVTSPWKPWKFCYKTSGPTVTSPVTVDGKSTGVSLVGNRRDFYKFIVTTENGTRYVYASPTLSQAYFPGLSSPYNTTDFTFVSTWRLRAILAPNYTGADIPDGNSNGGWVKIVYKAWDFQADTPDSVTTVADAAGRIVAQATYPYYVETPTHFAFFRTAKRYDRDLAFFSTPCGSACNGSPQNYFYRKLEKITLYKKLSPDAPLTEPAFNDTLNLQTTGTAITEVAFKYLANGAETFSQYNTAIHRQMLSKLILTEMKIQGQQGTSSAALPAYKFTYYDTLLSWIDVTEDPNVCTPGDPNSTLRFYQDDFGFLQSTGMGNPSYCIGGPQRSIGRMWSLKQITYPEGGRHLITYANDSLAAQSLSYKKYNGTSTAYSQINGTFARAEQGGARVQTIATYNGYNDATPDIVSFSYGPGRYSTIPELYFRKLFEYRTLPLYAFGERGQANVTYDWVKQKFADNSAIKTFYFTGDAISHYPEPQMLYQTGAHVALLQGNKNWNWGESTKVEYLDAGYTKIKEEVYNWTFEGDYADTTPLILATVIPRLIYSSGTPDSIYLHFTHKELASKVVKHYFGANVMNAKELYTYNDGTLLATKTEIPADTPFDDMARKTEYFYAHKVSTSSPYSDMRRENLRSQMAQVTVKKIIDYTAPPAAPLAPEDDVASTATSWRAELSESEYMYLPDQEYRWRKSVVPSLVPAFDWSAPPGECSNCNEWMRAQTFVDYDLHGNPTRINDAYNNETTIFWDATSTLIDSITTRPNATTTLTTRYAYDPNTFKLTSTTDPNGQKTEYKYDPLQRLIQTIMPDKRVASELAYYYSRQGVGNNEAFNATDPNYVKTRALGGAEFFEAFEYTDTTANHGWGVHFSTSPGSMKTVYDNTLQSRVLRVDVISGSNEGYAVKYPATGELNTKSKHLWVKTKSNLGNSSFRVVVVRDGLEYSLRYYFDNGTNGYDSGSRFITIYLGAAFKDGNWHTLERDLEQDFKLTNLSTSYEYVKRVVAVGEYDLDNIQLQNHPVTSFAFADGVGRGIQTLQYDSTGAIKAGTFYDTQDRVVKVTKPFWHGNTKFVRVDSVIDYANSYYSTKHPAYHDSLGVNEFDTGTHAYTETDYFPDPLHRVRHQYAPGDTFSSAGNRYVKYRYGTNVAGEMGITNAASVFETRLFDENGVKTEIFTDTFGNKVAVRNDSGGPNNNGNTSKLATAFQYDIVNNLTKIAPPKAFNIADNNTPDWNSVFCTVMTYNSLSQLTSRQTPDAGTDSMFYDKKGNLRFIKDANGQAASTKYFIYYKYDNLNRKTEEGTLTVTSPTNFNQSNADDPSFPTAGAWKVKYYYDVSTDPNQRNLKSRLYRMDYKTDRYPNMTGYIFYSYDANGNVEWTRQNIPKSNVNDGNGYLNAQIDYQYDALGKVTKTYFRRTFPPGVGSNAIYLWYDYDAMGRLENVYTNTADARIAPPNARYTYWPGGQVKRLVVGGSAQGVDYLYNSRDWLTQINHQNLWHTQDPGGDGGPGSNVYNVDRFGQIIGYNKQKQIATGHADFAAQFNGNISWTIHRTTGNVKPVAVNSNLTGWVFKYDKANRLTKSNWGHYTTSWQTSNRYDLTGIVYDRHGNLEYMTRYDTASVATNMDYLYTANTNKLHQISGLNGQGANNYTYDANGNMISDKKKLGSATGDTIAYDYRNLPYRVTKSLSPAGTINFGYDGKGQRVSKNNLYYVPGLDGRVVAVYDDKGTLLYWNLWGLDLIGQRFWKQ